MARAFLLSHGARVGSAADTFVPAGRTIAFYSEFDETTLREYGLAALNHGDIQPTETLVGPCPVSNYYHSKFEDEAIAQHLAVESSATGGKSYYVGPDLPDPSWLCTTPAACKATHPQHAAGCQGVFKLIAEEEIWSVACRGLYGSATSKSTMKLAGSTDLDVENETEAKRILAWAQTDPDAAMAYWQSLSQASQVLIASSWNPLKNFAEQYFAGGGASTPEAVLEARRYLEAYGNGTFYSWVNEMDETGRQRQLIMGDADLAAAFQRGWAEVDPRGALFDGTTATTPDPTAQLSVRIDEQAIAIASAVAQFSGSEADDVDAVAQAFSAIMADLESYQRSVGDERAPAAASLYAAGADVGSKLALHQEQHDADSLAQLVGAVEILCQWSKSITAV
jgi:hypothetical protein